MRIFLAFAVVAFGHLAAAAQTVMDGSDKGLDSQELKRSLELLTTGFVDPYGAQIRRLRIRGSGFCGEVNIKGAGGYLGFVPFYSSVRDNRAEYVLDDDEIRDFYKAKVAALCG